ncbi:dihydroorotate dehydrogenase [candidate division MSBL1 archaeon SCGC-AAA259E19]|uniref:Dihydroorotate dehydrogenase n=1 Tax=candidate division MSBL1 archaeon SCGC-AAA259E19 TaxID=1698264 RepID=A0A133UNG1_9EURY|nr:dihydroorotate dehydrogenase [candidate division MSBL1 archaeon SCGC-AAA259E19]
MQKENLHVHLGDLHLRNPTLLAAGIMGLTGASLKRVWDSGAGGVITKSVSKEAREGYSGPRVVETPCGLINSMGLPNPGIESMLEEIKIAKDSGGLVIGSIFGNEVKEFAELAGKIDKVGADAIELNLSCPHAENLSTIGQNPKLTKKVIEACKDSEIPIWVKLPGNTHIPNLIEVAKSAEKAGADAIVLTNTLPAMSIDVTSERPILGNITGGLSGPAIKPIGLRLVYEVYEKVDIPIIGAGGVESGKDMIEYILAGASAVEIGTGIMKRDLDVFKKVCEEASTFLDERKVKDLVGSAHKN